MLNAMADRIITLEDALRIHCDDSHPLLSPECDLPSAGPREYQFVDNFKEEGGMLLDVQTVSLADERGQRYFAASAAEVSRRQKFEGLLLSRNHFIE